MTNDDFGWGPPPLTEEQEERAAVLEYEAGLSREESEERARKEHPSNETSTISSTSKEIYTTFPHRNCDGIIVSEDIFKKSPIPTEINRLTVSEHTVTESGQSHPCNTRARSDGTPDHSIPPMATSEPAFELPLSREQEIKKILVERIECPPEVSSYVAPECLAACLQKGFDPIVVMTDLALAWRMTRHEPGMPPIERIGTWLSRKIHHWRDPSLPYGAPASDAPKRAATPDWAELRRRIIAGAVEGGEVRGADLRDYWDHQMAQGKLHALDAQISHAIAALERAGCCHRHGNALSITAEVLRIEPAERHKVSKQQGMERLQRAVQRRWPAIKEQWQDIVDVILCNLNWWRNMLGEGLGGLADWIDDERGNNPTKDNEIEYAARRLRQPTSYCQPRQNDRPVNDVPISRPREDGPSALTEEELVELEAQKKRLAQVN